MGNNRGQNDRRAVAKCLPPRVKSARFHGKAFGQSDRLEDASRRTPLARKRHIPDTLPKAEA